MTTHEAQIAALRARLDCAPPRPVSRPAPSRTTVANITQVEVRDGKRVRVRAAPEPEARPEPKSPWASWTINAQLIQIVLQCLAAFAFLPPEYQIPAAVGIAVFTAWDRYRKSDVRKDLRAWLGLRALS